MSGRHNLIDNAVLFGLLSGHEHIAVEVACDTLDRLSGVVSHDLPHLRLLANKLAGLDFDVRGVPADAANTGRMLVDGGVREGEALARRARAEQDGRHRGSQPYAKGADIRA